MGVGLIGGVMKKPKICVVGSNVMDLISYVDKLPALGETLKGKRFHMGFGGKGANQAVMAAKLGCAVTMVTRMGNDIFGENTLNNFNELGVNTDHALLTNSSYTGVAPIAVDPDGNNSIIFIPGANDLLSPQDIDAAKHVIAEADVLVCQLEIPVELTILAMQYAKENGVKTIFNPAPAMSNLPNDIFQLTDYICPNETETEMITGRSVKTIEDAEHAAQDLLSRGSKTVILTLGERGSLFATKDQTELISSEPVTAVDTTGAGDCFVGSLAYFVALDKPIEEAINQSNRIAALSVQKNGTQTSFPDLEDLMPHILTPLDESSEKSMPNIDDEDKSNLDLSQYIDHTVLKSEATVSDVDKLCVEAIQYNFKSVCVNSCFTSYVVQKLQGTSVDTCAVIGFPLGAMSAGAKAFEASQAVEDGATELDMVINVGELKAGNFQKVEDDIMAVRQAAPVPVVLKVIIETCLLTDEEKIKACEIVKRGGADFVKTSTGFSSNGAVISDIVLMRKTVGPNFGVKASGGIKDTDTTREMIMAGANRIGTSSGVKIVSG